MATNHTMDWDECLICQGEKNENLRGRDEGGSYATLSTLLPKFASIGAFSLEKFGCENDSPATIEAKFKENRAVYHKSCVSDYSKLKLERATKKYDKEERKRKESASVDNQDNKRAKRSDPSSTIKMGELKCIFCTKVDDGENLCAAGTLHATDDDLDHTHNNEFTEKLREKALKIGDSRLMSILAVKTVAVNEYYYHKHCLISFNNQYNKYLNDEQKRRSIDMRKIFREHVHFRKIIGFIQDQRRLGLKSFEVTPLENMYFHLLDCDGIDHNRPHVGRFGERLRKTLAETYSADGIEVRNIDNKVTLLFSSDIENILKEELSPYSFVESLLQVVTPIRDKMAKVEKFRIHFPLNAKKSRFQFNFKHFAHC